MNSAGQYVYVFVCIISSHRTVFDLNETSIRYCKQKSVLIENLSTAGTKNWEGVCVQENRLSK
jgi:hypothetical protein